MHEDHSPAIAAGSVFPRAYCCSASHLAPNGPTPASPARQRPRWWCAAWSTATLPALVLTPDGRMVLNALLGV